VTNLNPEVALIDVVVRETERSGVGPTWALAITEAVASAAPHIAALARSGDDATVDRVMGFLVDRAKAAKVADETAKPDAPKPDTGKVSTVPKP
jgi:hypothetical protein